MELVSSDGGSDATLFTDTNAKSLVASNPTDGSAVGTNGEFSLTTDEDLLCIPAGKVIGIKVGGGSTALEAVITLEFEELPLLIGGVVDYDLGNIYCYSFALKPEEHQPSGTCNFSRIDSSQLIFDDAPGSDSNLKVFAVNYNVLRIMSGMGGLAYSN